MGKPDCEGLDREGDRGPGASLPRHETFSADVRKLPGNFSPKVANAFLLAVRRSLQLCRGAALCLQGHLDSSTISSLESGPAHEEPNLAEHPPTSGELTELWGRSTGLPLDSQKVFVARRVHGTARRHHPVISSRVSRSDLSTLCRSQAHFSQRSAPFITLHIGSRI